MKSGAIMGKKYCAMFLKLTMPVCDACRYFERRIEFYSNMPTGCKDEFEVKAPEPEKPKPEPEKPKPEEKEEVTEPDSGRYFAIGTATVATIAASLF